MKAKGSNAERELVTMFWGNSWAAVRTAGSGVQKFYCPDVLASNGKKILAIECKSTKHKHQYFDTQQINDLIEFSKIFSAEPWIAVKFSTEWKFFKPGDLEQTEKNLTVKKESTKAKIFSDVTF